jgi:hypothetical protein
MDKVIRNGWARVLAISLLLSGWAQAQNKVLVVRPAGATFEEARKGIVETLGEGWQFHDLVAGKDFDAKVLAEQWKSAAPQAIVLMDNRSVNAYREARTLLGDTTTPVVALMGVRIDLAITQMGNVVGVNYEIPAVTSMVNLRSVLPSPLRRIGVVYRASWGDFFQRQAEFCAPESLQLVGRSIPDEGDPAASLRKALEELLVQEKVDVLWILNDNLFLNAKIIQSVWMPMVKKAKVLSVVGVEPLVNPALDFGSFAVLPDHYALGSQVAGLLQEIQEMSWKVEDPRADQPLSVVKILNAKQVKNRSGLRGDKLGEIDKVLE